MPFSKEDLDFLDKRYARIPHDHTWDQIKDVDGETLTDRVIMIDSVLDELEGGESDDEGEEDDEV